VSARTIAFDVLTAVREDDAYANLLLPTLLDRAKLSARDAGFATELAYGTLRMRGYYDAVIAVAAGRAVAKIDPPVLDILRLACHQLLSMRVAPHGALDESVRLTKTVSKSASGFVNGVLRTITRTDPDQWRERVLTGVTGDARLAIEHSHPEWVVAAVRASLGADPSPVLAADNRAPAVSLVALPGLAEPDGTGTYSPYAQSLYGGNPVEAPGVRDGIVRVQDEGSQLAALALAAARPIVAGERWLDLCAGPGGKAALLAAIAALNGATLTANELVPARAQLVRKALSVLDPVPEVLELDGTTIGTSHPEAFDRILLDAPCTGLGALRRRPEARWRKQPSDVAQLARLQGELLDSALAALAPGGVLAYVTCSPVLAETRDIISGTPGLMDTPAVLAGVTTRPLDLPGETWVQLWPHQHGTDAMFIQLIQKPAR
jgi:16S rRNA (cytosine967-C5)-methyltransferase